MSNAKSKQLSDGYTANFYHGYFCRFQLTPQAELSDERNAAGYGVMVNMLDNKAFEANFAPG